MNKDEIKLVANQKLKNPTLLQFFNEGVKNKTSAPRKNILKLVSSEFKKHNAQNALLRLDCNLKLKEKNAFLQSLKVISAEENINVLFYLEKDFGNETNLMIFFTNGRQGLNLSKKQFVDVISFENKLEEAIIENDVNIGHVGGFENYPRSETKIEMMVDQEFII